MATAERSPRATIRDDFMRRLFAVAVSVGFATSLSRMDWLTAERLPDRGEFEHLAVLITALCATVLSWDGYLVSIQTKPLERFPRFLIDISLVFIYMALLITSGSPSLWLDLLVVIFFLYFAWDVLSIREHFSQYRDGEQSVGRFASVAQIGAIYRDGFLNLGGVKKGPIITAMWWLYFFGLATINRQPTVDHQTLIMCAFAIAGLSLYRVEKIDAFRTRTRGLVIFALLLGVHGGLFVLQGL